jgi:PAS domain S-box-containing protein
LFNDQGEVTSWCGTNTDIEDLKRAEGDLRRSKVYLEHAQRLSHTGGVGLRLPDGEIFWSEETARIYGYHPTIRPTMEMVLQRVHPEDVGHLIQVFERAMEGGASFDFEHRLLMPDGSIKYLRNFAHSVIDGAGQEEVLGAVMDITEQYHAKAALKEALAKIKKSEEELRTTIDTIPALAWSSPEDGLGDFFSKRWLDYTGLSHEEAQGTGWIVAIHPDDVGTLADTWTKIRASGREGGLEARLRRFDGVYRWFLFRAAPLRDPEGKDVVWYGTNTDIEDLKQAETELRGREADLRKAQAELAHVTRVTTMGELAASIAHEVSQPIAGVMLNGNTCVRWLSQLKEDSAALAGAREALQRIIRDGTRAGEVITRIRALFKKTEIAKESLEINAVIQEAIVLSRIEMEKRRVVLRLEMAPDLPRILGDRVQLQQVLINLILNGLEAMSEVEFRPRELVIGTQLHEGAQVLATVRDSGVGFDPADIEQLFTAFQTTKPGGLGMGLSISRSIVENHGGRLWATGNEGDGATFHFTLPLEFAAQRADRQR